MKRSREESHQGSNIDGYSVFSMQKNNIFLEEVPFPPLNLPLTTTPEFIKEIESVLKQCYSCPHQQKLHGFTENTSKTLTPPETPKNPEKPKAINFAISKITIGEWTRLAVFPEDLKAKFYFAKKKLMWENLDYVETGTKMTRLKKKIEIQWADVLSLRASFHSHDETEILELELRKRPTFFMETNPQAGKHTQWKQIDEDFTQNQASICRRHTLHFAPGVLQSNLEKLVSGNSFWSELIKVNFPSLKNLYFDIGYGNNNNDNNSINSSGYNDDQTLSFNVNNDLLHNHSQGFGHMPVEEVNFDIATQFGANDGRQTNSYDQDNNGQNNTANQLPGTQVIQPSAQLFIEHHNMGGHFSGSQFDNPMIQIRNTGGLHGSDQPLLEAQTNNSMMMFPHMNELSSYSQVGPYLQGTLFHGERQNMVHTHFDGNFQINGTYYDQFANNDYDQRLEQQQWFNAS